LPLVGQTPAQQILVENNQFEIHPGRRSRIFSVLLPLHYRYFLEGISLSPESRKLPGFIVADGAITMDNAYPHRWIFGGGIKVDGSKTEGFAIGDPG